MSEPIPPEGENVGQGSASQPAKTRNTVSIQTAPRHATSVDNAAVRLGMVLQLTQRARQASQEELPFIMVNETRQLIPYRQAAFWQVEGGNCG